MERKIDRRRRYRKPYEPSQNWHYMRKNNFKDCHNAPYGKFHHSNQYNLYNQYQYNQGKEAEITNYTNSFNCKSSSNREMQNNSSITDMKNCPWSEEAAEEERKRQVSVTANQLKNKLKMWNTVKSDKVKVNEDRSSEKTNEVIGQDVSRLPTESSENKDMSLNTMNNESLIQESVQSHMSENNKDERNFHTSRHEMSCKTSKNTGTSFKINSFKFQKLSKVCKKSQKKIQQSLIGELMALPKASLKKVLLNPQTQSKIEQKMAQIVKENRLILAQKFRTLAESKINQQGQFVCSKFVNDVEDLIDPDLAVDLCQLPPELITQISDIFQLDFESSLKVPEFQENSNNDENKKTLKSDENSVFNYLNTESRISQDNVMEVSDIRVEPQIFGNAKCNDLLKDKVISEMRKLLSPKNFNSTLKVESTETSPHLSSSQSSSVALSEKDVNANDCCEMPSKYGMLTQNTCFSKIFGTLSSHSDNCNILNKLPFAVDERSYLAKKIKSEPEGTEEQDTVSRNGFENFSQVNIGGSISVEQNGRKPEGEILNIKRDITQPEKVLKNGNPMYRSVETQTDINLLEADHSQPFLGQLYSGSEEESLLREVGAIDDLLHRLNQRRFIIFLKLVGLKSCNLNNNNLKTSLMEAITNSDVKLMKDLSVGSNKKREKKMNTKRKKNSDDSKNLLKKPDIVKNCEKVNVMDQERGLNIQDPVRGNKKFGGKTGNWKNRNKYA